MKEMRGMHHLLLTCSVFHVSKAYMSPVGRQFLVEPIF